MNFLLFWSKDEDMLAQKKTKLHPYLPNLKNLLVNVKFSFKFPQKKKRNLSEKMQISLIFFEKD
jgi:hypothetical protein